MEVHDPIKEANTFWYYARERVLRIAHQEGLEVHIAEHDDEGLFDMFDGGKAFPTDMEIRHMLHEMVQESLQGPEVKPQTPDQADDTSVQPTAVTAEDVLKLIRFHNLTVDTFERVGKAVKVDGWLFGGMEMWHRLEEITNDICVCGAQATAWDALEVQMLGEQWLKLANVWPQDLIIKSHYTSGPEIEKPWPEHLFCLSLEHQGVIYFTLMNGEQIDRAGIDIIDKDALLRGEG